MFEINKMKNYLQSFGFGALCSLAFAPFHFFIAAIISLSAFYFLLEKSEAKKPIFWVSFFYGFGYFVSGVYWIAISLLVDVQFFWLIPFALTLIPAVLALYFVGFALSYKFFLQKFKFEKSYQKIIIFAVCWLVFEVLRSNLFSGFPWNLIGYIWLFDVHFAQLAKVFGIYGLSLFAVLICLFPVLLFAKGGKKISSSEKFFGIILALLFAANLVYGILEVDEDKITYDSQVLLRLVQGNIQQEMKWDAEEKYQNLIKHIKLTNAPNLDKISAVIWSETAVPYAIDDNEELLDLLRKATPDNGLLITGALKFDYTNSTKTTISQAWNSVFTLDKSGIVAIYHKHHLVPFGEYIPLQKYLPFVEKITEGSLGFSAGEGAKTIQTKQFSFSPLVCYEVIFSNEIIEKNSQPDLLINVTNDAWFGKSSGPYQHLDIARMRSIEYATSMARVANTGVTAFIDPFGRVVDKIDLGKSGIIDIALIKKLAPTIYRTYLEIPLVVVVFFLLAILLILKSKYDSR
jgi:apolipoprotein N-acyltransferase